MNCPKCNEEIPKGSVNCPACDELLESVDTQEDSIDIGEMPELSITGSLPDAEIQLEMPSFLMNEEQTETNPAETSTEELVEESQVESVVEENSAPQPDEEPQVQQPSSLDVEAVSAQEMFSGSNEETESRAGVLPESMLQANLAPLEIEEPVEEPQAEVPVVGEQTSLTPSIPVLEQPVMTEDEKNTAAFREKVVAKITTTTVIALSIVAIGIVILFSMSLMTAATTTNRGTQRRGTTLIAYEGFRLYVPENIVSEIIEGELFLSDVDETWSAIITLRTGNFLTLISNRIQLGEAFEKFGYIVEEPTETTIVGKSFVTFEVSMGMERVLVAYTRASGTKIWGIILRNEDAEYSDDSLREISMMLNQATFDGVSQGLPEGFRIDMFEETFKVSR